MTSKEYAQIAAKLRIFALKAIYSAGSGHLGGSLSLADIMAVLYGDKLNINASDPQNINRDRLILSKGHAAPILYAALAYKGFFDSKELTLLRTKNSFLQGHPDMKHTPGVDMTTGSLGQGISAACGIALGLKTQKIKSHVFAIIGDGEMDEGQVWEALMFANQYHLSNLTVILDYNKLQIDGTNSAVMEIAEPAEKFRSFHFNVIEIDGHNYEQISSAINIALSAQDKPTAIIAHTVKGKGVSFMENQVGWHGKAPDADEYAAAIKELRG